MTLAFHEINACDIGVTRVGTSAAHATIVASLIRVFIRTEEVCRPRAIPRCAVTDARRTSATVHPSARHARHRLPVPFTHVAGIPDGVIGRRLTLLWEHLHVFEHAHRIHVSKALAVPVHVVPRTAAVCTAIVLHRAFLIDAREREVRMELERIRREEVINTTPVSSLIERTAGERCVHVHLIHLVSLHASLLARIKSGTAFSASHAARTGILTVA